MSDALALQVTITAGQPSRPSISASSGILVGPEGDQDGSVDSAVALFAYILGAGEDRTPSRLEPLCAELPACAPPNEAAPPPPPPPSPPAASQIAGRASSDLKGARCQI